MSWILLSRYANSNFDRGLNLGSSLLGSRGCCLLGCFGSGSSLLCGCCLLGGNGEFSELSDSGGGCFGFLAFFGGGIGEFPELSDSGGLSFLAFFFGGGESAETGLGGGFFGLELEASS